MKKYIIIFLIMITLISASAARSQVIVIANAGVKASEISKGDLRDVFTGATTALPGGGSVVPVLLKAGTVHEEFIKAYIGKSDTAFRAGWRSLVFSGQASMPKSLDGEAAVVEFVLHSGGAVGYISRATPHEGVKVLTVR